MYKRMLALFGAVALMGGGCWLYPTDDRQPDAMEPKNGAPSQEQPENGNGMENGEGNGEIDAAATGSWRMTKVDGPGREERDVSTLDFTLTLDSAGRLGAQICNSMGGDYSIRGGRLETAEVVSTLRFCPGIPGEIEALFTADLATGMTVSAAGNTLSLTGNVSGNVYTFVKR